MSILGAAVPGVIVLGRTIAGALREKGPCADSISIVAKGDSESITCRKDQIASFESRNDAMVLSCKCQRPEPPKEAVKESGLGCLPGGGHGVSSAQQFAETTSVPSTMVILDEEPSDQELAKDIKALAFVKENGGRHDAVCAALSHLIQDAKRLRDPKVYRKYHGMLKSVCPNYPDY